jgi:hypothetical protein
MFIKKPKHRKFDYQPRYYKPSEDDSERKKRKLGFRSNYKNKTSVKIPWPYIIMILFIVYLFLKFNGYI